MSHEEWEHGTITLPRDQFTKVRRAFVDRHNELEQRAFDAAKTAWNEATPKQKKDSDFLRERIDKLTEPKTRWAGDRRFYSYQESVDNGESEVRERAADLLQLNRWNSDPRPPQKKNMKVLPASTTSFDGGERGGYVSFQQETGAVKWDVGGNHASDYADYSWTAACLKKELDNVQWTRSSGGVLHHGSETTMTRPMRSYGPIGLAEAPEVLNGLYTRSDGTKLRKQELDDAIAKTKRKEARNLRAQAKSLTEQASMLEQGRTRGGQYDFKRGSAPGIRL